MRHHMPFHMAPGPDGKPRVIRGACGFTEESIELYMAVRTAVPLAWCCLPRSAAAELGCSFHATPAMPAIVCCNSHLLAIVLIVDNLQPWPHRETPSTRTPSPPWPASCRHPTLLTASMLLSTTARWVYRLPGDRAYLPATCVGWQPDACMCCHALLHPHTRAQLVYRASCTLLYRHCRLTSCGWARTRTTRKRGLRSSCTC